MNEQNKNIDSNTTSATNLIDNLSPKFGAESSNNLPQET